MAAEPTLRATVHAQFAVTTQRDCLEEQFCFASTWFFGPLSLVAMFRYIRFPQIMHGKHIGNRNDERFEKQGALSDKKLLNNFNFLSGK